MACSDWHYRYIFCLTALGALLASCQDDATVLHIDQPTVHVSHVDVPIEGRVEGPHRESVDVRYELRAGPTSGPTGPLITSGTLPLDDRGSFRASVKLDEAGLYALTLIVNRGGEELDRDSRDFRLEFTPPPAPRLLGFEADTPLLAEDFPLVYALDIETQPGLRIEVQRGGTLLARQTAQAERITLDVALVEGDNRLTITAWSARASASVEAMITTRRGTPDAGADDAAVPMEITLVGSTDDPPSRRAPVPPSPPADGPNVPPPSPPHPLEAIESACDDGEVEKAARLNAPYPNRALPPALAICVARGNLQAGRCSVAERLVRGLDDSIEGQLISARCRLRAGEKRASADAYQRAVELAVSGRARLPLDPTAFGAELDRAGFDARQRERLAGPCKGHGDDPLCRVLVPPTVESACRAGDASAAAQLAEAGAEVPPKAALCVGEAWLAAGRRDAAATQLERALSAATTDAERGRAATRLIEATDDQRARGAMRTLVELASTGRHPIDDPRLLGRQIGRAFADESDRRAITAPCGQRADVPTCAQILTGAGIEPGPEQTKAAEPPSVRATTAAAEVQGDPAPAPAAAAAANNDEADPTVPRPAPSKEAAVATRTPPPEGPPPPPAREHQIELDPSSGQFALEQRGRFETLAARGGRVVVDDGEVGIGPRPYRVRADGNELRGTIDLARVVKKKLDPVRLHIPKAAARRAYSGGVAALGRSDWPGAIKAFTEATRADDRYCMAWAYLGHAQSMSGAHGPAGGSFARCSSSLGNDSEGVTTARVLQAVSQAQQTGEGASAKALESLVKRLENSGRAIAKLHRTLPKTSKSPVPLSALQRYWLAVSRERLYRRLTADGARADEVEAARKKALTAWRKLPANVSTPVDGRLIQTRTSFADERQRKIRALEAAGETR